MKTPDVAMFQSLEDLGLGKSKKNKNIKSTPGRTKQDMDILRAMRGEIRDYNHVVPEVLSFSARPPESKDKRFKSVINNHRNPQPSVSPVVSQMNLNQYV